MIKLYLTPGTRAGRVAWLEIARDANVEHLLIYHSIPTPRNALMERVFFRPIEGVFENYSLSDDGTRVIMPVGNDDIFIDEIN